MAHAALINGGRCTALRPGPPAWPPGDQCTEWTRLHNVVIEGGGLIDGRINRSDPQSPVFGRHDLSNNPTLLGLLWVDGLTVRDVVLRRPAFWTVHVCFCNNVRVTGIDVLTTLGGMDAIDLDSSWNASVEPVRTAPSCGLAWVAI